MTNSAALSGDYVDLRFIKSRKVCQVIIEIPIEQGGAFVGAFGTPNPATGVPVAIARLQEPEKQQAEKPKRSWSEMPRSQQAGIACEDKNFWAFINEIHDVGITDPDAAARVVRNRCFIRTRADLDTNQQAGALWDKLYSDYQMWKAGAAA